VTDYSRSRRNTNRSWYFNNLALWASSAERFL